MYYLRWTAGCREGSCRYLAFTLLIARTFNLNDMIFSCGGVCLVQEPALKAGNNAHSMCGGPISDLRPMGMAMSSHLDQNDW